jgi:nicotinic acid mononucleotide adenylyltransferase
VVWYNGTLAPVHVGHLFAISNVAKHLSRTVGPVTSLVLSPRSDKYLQFKLKKKASPSLLSYLVSRRFQLLDTALSSIEARALGLKQCSRGGDGNETFSVRVDATENQMMAKAPNPYSVEEVMNSFAQQCRRGATERGEPSPQFYHLVGSDVARHAPRLRGWSTAVRVSDKVEELGRDVVCLGNKKTGAAQRSEDLLRAGGGKGWRRMSGLWMSRICCGKGMFKKNLILESRGRGEDEGLSPSYNIF